MPKVVLVIDDEQPIREFVTALLVDEGWDARPYASASAALTDLARDGFTPDLILLDMRMPGLDGWQFAEAIRARGITVPLVVMTAARDARHWAAEVGAVGFLPKPFDIDQAVNEIERVIGPPDERDGAGGDSRSFISLRDLLGRQQRAAPGIRFAYSR